MKKFNVVRTGLVITLAIALLSIGLVYAQEPEPTVEVTPTVVAEPTEEPIVEPTAESVAEPAQEPAVEPTEEPVVEPTEEPAEEPAAEPVEEPAAASVAQGPGVAAIPDPGAGSSNIYFQNLGTAAADVTVEFYNPTTGASDWSWNTGSSPIPQKGVGRILYTQFGGSITDGWIGSSVMASSQPLAAIVNLFWSGNSTAAAYTGVDAPSTEIYLPNLLKRDGRQTRVTVQNAESTAATVYLNYYNRDGALVYATTDVISGNLEATYYLDQVAGVDFSSTAGTGSLYITSTNRLAAAASLHWDTMSAAYSGVSSGDTTLWIPSMFRKQSDGVWRNYNAVIVQNLGSATAEVTVNFIGKSASYLTTSVTDTIPAKASAGYNMITQGTASDRVWTVIQSLGTNWVGTVKVVSDNSQPLAGVCFYFAKSVSPDVMAFNGIRATDATTSAVSMPAVYRKYAGTDPGGTLSDQWSTTLIQNLDPTDVTITTKFYDTSGNQVGATAGYTTTVPANGSVGLNLWKGVDLPSQALTDLGKSFSGAMYVESDGTHQIIGVTNLIYSGRNRAAAYPGFPAD